MVRRERQKENNGEDGMELLAPVGSRAAFAAAVRGGADAVYVGAPGLNARNLARDFTLAEIGTMCRDAHDEQVKFYIAMNSLMREEEIPAAVEMLARFAAMGIDALIVQDLGILRLARHYFPELRLHASTLLGGHNSMTVRQFAALGFSRTVLARELSLPEIRAIHQHCNGMELEVFVHGALCFSFSGLCLCSSYLGGKSSMRGHCVQPCRRRYQWQGGGRGRGRKAKRPATAGYPFSMNDLCAIELLPELQRAGVTSLKIEGRLRSPQYVTSVVRAYRIALDGLGEMETFGAALDQAQSLLEQAMGRRTTRGYLQTARADEIISPGHSGNIGLFLGRIQAGGRQGARLLLRREVAAGDRLRLHREQDGERIAFTLKNMSSRGKPTERGEAGDEVLLEVPASFRPGDSLYKVDTREGRAMEAEAAVAGPRGSARRLGKRFLSDRVQPRIDRVLADIAQSATRHPSSARPPVQGRRRRPGPPAGLELWLKSDDPGILKLDLPLMPDRLLLVLDKESFAGFNRLRKISAQTKKRLIWVLPPVIRERDLGFFDKAVEQLLRQGFRAFQLGHVGQIGLFGRRRPFLAGDYTLNVANSQAALLLLELAIQRTQLAIEADRRLVAELGRNYPGLGMTVYGTPPLFTSWLTGRHLKGQRHFVSPKGEEFVLREKGGITQLLADQPFSLLPLLPELQAMGVGYAVMDVGHGRPAREIRTVLETLAKGGPWKGRLSTFNFSGSYR